MSDHPMDDVTRDIPNDPNRFPADDPNGNIFKDLYRRIAEFRNIPVQVRDVGDFYHRYSLFNGFYNKGIMPIPGVLGHIHCEVSEAWHRWYKLDSDEAACATDDEFAQELADIIIMTCLLAEQHGIDLDQAIRDKTRKNLSRGIRHGKK